MNIRNRLLPPPPPANPPSTRSVRSVTLTAASHTETAPGPGTGSTALVVQRSIDDVPTISKNAAIPESHPDVSEQDAASDAEAESNYGDLESTGVGSSWVSLGPHESSE